MKIISCASYYGSGSSAVTDLLSEFENIYSLTDYEFRFVHDPDGISDLEYNLVENFNRHNSGHAIKRFLKLSQFNSGKFFNKRYEPFFNNKYMEITKEYVSKLIDFKFNGYWFYDLYDRGWIYYYIKQLQSKILKILFNGKYTILSKEMTYAAHPTEEKFLFETKKYINNLLMVANKENKPYVMVDQIVPSSNLERYLRYFNDIFVLVVDRDPRDIFVLEKYYWKTKVIPTEDVNIFCDWYLYARENKNECQDSQKILYVQFEDLIFNYDEKISEIIRFLNLSETNHMKKFDFFNPKKSENNTQVWKKTKIDESEISIIENRLKKYLYPFEKKEISQIKGREVEKKEIF